MPLYMDRHDVPDASRQDVAAAHVSDVELSEQFGVDFLSYWFDESVGGVFCFAKANTEDDLRSVHEASHGLVPNEIIEVSEDDMLRFLGDVHNPRNASELTSPVRTVAFTDLVGSTALLSAYGEARYMEFIGTHDSIVRRALIRHRGREIKHTGDGIMAAFDAAGDAARWAVDCLGEFRRRDGDPQLSIRIGLASGIPVDRNEDIYGETVVLASRLCDGADPDCALTTEEVRVEAVGLDLPFAGPILTRLKGFPQPVEAYRLGGSQPASEPKSGSLWDRLRAVLRSSS